MTRSTPAGLLFSLLSLSACGAAPDDPGAVGTTESAIAWGTPVASVKGAAVGVLIDGQPYCSATFVDEDLAFTSRDCAESGKLWLDTASSKVRMRRLMFGHTTDVVVLQTSRRVAPPRYSRDVDPMPLAVGDVVNCMGYDDVANPTLRAGSFEVVDGSSATKYYLESRGMWTEVTYLDRGGFCYRDGGTDVAAILTGPSKDGIAVATPMHGARDGLRDVRRAASNARRGAAVRFRAPLYGNEFLTDRLQIPTAVTVDPLDPGYNAHQAFYLEPVSNPPGGGSDWYRLVIARDGRCVIEDASGSLVSESCRGRPEEVFQVTSLGNLQYRIRSTRGCVDQGAGTWVSVAPCTSAPSLVWEMWLAPY